MSSCKHLTDEIISRYNQNAKGFRIYSGSDSDGFCLRDPRGFSIYPNDIQGHVIGFIECLNDIPKLVEQLQAKSAEVGVQSDRAERWRDAFKRKHNLLTATANALSESQARVKVLEDALKYYSDELCPADDPSDKVANDALASSSPAQEVQNT